MKLYKSIVILLSFATAVFSAQPVCGETTDSVAFSYEKGTYSNVELPYRKAVIAAEASAKKAVVIYLHGGTSKGNDNEKQMGEPGVDSISNYLQQQSIASTFVVPQCPTDKSWNGAMMMVLKGLIDEQLRADDADRSRVYIFGGSMGGTGTWTMLSLFPGLFTAAMPVAGNPSACKAENVVKTPVYTVMGTADRIMKMENTSDFIDSLNLLGADTKFDIEQRWTHENVCMLSYTRERLQWVFTHGSSSGVDEAEVHSAAVTIVSAGNGNLTLDSPIGISTVAVYAIDGRVLAHEHLGGANKATIEVRGGEKQPVIVRVSTTDGNYVVKKMII